MKYIIVYGSYLRGLVESIGPFWSESEAENHIRKIKKEYNDMEFLC